MATRKDVLRRYEILNECFTNKKKRYWTIQELLDVLLAHDIKISKRTLEDYLKKMCTCDDLRYYAPIDYSTDNKGHYYVNADYSIKRVLSDQDRANIKGATNALKKFSGVPYLNQFRGSILKAINLFDQHADEEHDEDIIIFEPNASNKGLENYETVHKACRSKQPLTINYKKFGHVPSKHTVHPYNLKEYKGLWYLYCYSEGRDKIVILALDRMIGIANAANITYKPNTFFQPAEYFKYIIGVTRFDQEPEIIELWFSPHQAHYIKAHALHHTQKIIKDDEKGLVITLKLIPNPELEEILNGYGPKCRVIGPKALRKSMKEMVMEKGELYANDD